MKKMNRLFLLLIIFLLLSSCLGRQKEVKKTETEEIITQEVNLKPDELKEKSLNKTEKEIVEVALSFHKWYIKNTNDIKSKTPIDFTVTEGKSDNCIIDYEPYFNELRKLGTVSNSFMEKEKRRTKLCAETISKMKWSEYIGVIPDNCDEYLFWTRSQEETGGIDFVDIKKVNEIWKVKYRLFNIFKNVKEYLPHSGIINIEKQDNRFLITEINWVESK